MNQRHQEVEKKSPPTKKKPQIITPNIAIITPKPPTKIPLKERGQYPFKSSIALISPSSCQGATSSARKAFPISFPLYLTPSVSIVGGGGGVIYTHIYIYHYYDCIFIQILRDAEAGDEEPVVHCHLLIGYSIGT